MKMTKRVLAAVLLCAFISLLGINIVLFLQDINSTPYAMALDNGELQNPDKEDTSFVENVLLSDQGDGEEWPYYAIEFGNKAAALSTQYPNYKWSSIKSIYGKSVSDISGRNPLSVQSYYNETAEKQEYGETIDLEYGEKVFNKSDVAYGLSLAQEEDSSIKSTYGGCGPIAQIGIWDYFGTALGYDEQMEYSADNNSKRLLAKEVFLNVETKEVGTEEKSTLTLPSDYRSGFNQLAQKFNVPINCEYKYSLFGGDRQEFVDKIIESIDKGIPVTVCTAKAGKNLGAYAGHYFNVCSYEKWVGINSETNERVEKYLFGTKLNYISTYGIRFVCEDIFDESNVGVFWYNVMYSNEQEFPAIAFATSFINDAGQGQYFFDEKDCAISLANGYMFNTKRLRCSYIENQYLVISANRISSTGSFNGQAYLAFSFSDKIKKIEFDISQWSAKERFSSDATVAIQCKKNGVWKNIRKISVDKIVMTKDSPQRMSFLIENGYEIRILVSTTPNYDGNKGRIVIDNMRIFYH